MKLSCIPKVGVVAREVMEMELGIGLGRGLSVKQDSDLGFSRPKTSLKYLGSLFFVAKLSLPTFQCSDAVGHKAWSSQETLLLGKRKKLCRAGDLGTFCP